MAETIDFGTGQWSELPRDLLTMVAERLNNTSATTLVDTLRLRSVCKSWRSSIPPFMETPTLPLTLPFPIAPNPALNRKRRSHFSLTQSTIYFLQPTPSESEGASYSKGHGWLLRVEEAENGKWRLLKPFFRTEVPRLKGFPKSLSLLNFRISEIGKAYSMEFCDVSYKKIAITSRERASIRVSKVVMSSSSSSGAADGYDHAVMAIQEGKLWLFKLGDKKWSPIDDPNGSEYDDVVCHKGKFYAVDRRGRAVVIGSDLRALEVASPMAAGRCGMLKHLVKRCDDLFLIDKYIDYLRNLIPCDKIVNAYLVGGYDSHLPIDFKVFKLDEENREWKWVKSVEDGVFFIGYDCSYSASAQDFPTALKGNCIYFPEPMFTGCGLAGLGVYSLEDDCYGPVELFPHHWPIIGPPPAWLNPKTSLNLKK